MSFADQAVDLYSVSVLVTIYVLSYNIGPRSNGTRLYILDVLNHSEADVS